MQLDFIELFGTEKVDCITYNFPGYCQKIVDFAVKRRLEYLHPMRGAAKTWKLQSMGFRCLVYIDFVNIYLTNIVLILASYLIDSFAVPLNTAVVQ